MAEHLVPFEWSNRSDTVGWNIYIALFYIVFSLFLLNMILAIIVDTFGELRDARAEAEFSKANSCFICSVDRETFKRKGVGMFFLFKLS